MDVTLADSLSDVIQSFVSTPWGIGLTGTWAAVLGSLVIFTITKSLEKQSVKKALRTEAKRLVEVLDKHLAWWDRRTETEKQLSLIPFSTDVFDGQIANIGALDKKLIGKAVHFFGYLKYLNAFQAIRRSYRKAGADFDTEYRKKVCEALYTHGAPFKGSK